MISMFGWPDPNMGFDQSEHALYTCYFIIVFHLHHGEILLCCDKKFTRTNVSSVSPSIRRWRKLKISVSLAFALKFTFCSSTCVTVSLISPNLSQVTVFFNKVSDTDSEPIQ